MKTEDYEKNDKWKKKLTPMQFHIMRKRGTEPAFTGKYLNNKKKGIYLCAGCGNELFDSDKKYDSGTGWPSFWAPVANNNIETKVDSILGMKRTEVLCRKCSSHLGHVFDDGPQPTGKRFCINSAALKFRG